jgi:hypothetical protein
MTQPTTTDPQALLTPAEVGRKIGRSRATVYRLINAGQIEVVFLPAAKPANPDQPGQGAARIPSAALDRFIASLERRAS